MASLQCTLLNQASKVATISAQRCDNQGAAATFPKKQGSRAFVRVLPTCSLSSSSVYGRSLRNGVHQRRNGAWSPLPAKPPKSVVRASAADGEDSSEDMSQVFGAALDFQVWFQSTRSLLRTKLSALIDEFLQKNTSWFC